MKPGRLSSFTLGTFLAPLNVLAGAEGIDLKSGESFEYPAEANSYGFWSGSVHAINSAGAERSTS
jgi:hypothetical protein